MVVGSSAAAAHSHVFLNVGWIVYPAAIFPNSVKPFRLQDWKLIRVLETVDLPFQFSRAGFT